MADPPTNTPTNTPTITPTLTPGTKYLDPAALAKLKNMGLAARLVVEGLFAGQHRSPNRGSSVEFAEHRQYTPGDDPRHLDWKLLGKTEKLYIKQYEEQTNLRGYILLDASQSMSYQYSGGLTKLEYASYLAATLAYLMHTQHDAFGLLVCGNEMREDIPPRQGRNHLQTVLESLEKVEPGGDTHLSTTVNDLAQRMQRRALVIVLSDFLGEPGGSDALVESLGHLRHRKHEVVAMQVLDQAELTFPFHDAGQIVDMESGHRVNADAEAIRRHYLDRLNDYLDQLSRGCQQREVGYALADTSQPFDTFLGRYLKQRERQGAMMA